MDDKDGSGLKLDKIVEVHLLSSGGGGGGLPIMDFMGRLHLKGWRYIKG